MMFPINIRFLFSPDILYTPLFISTDMENDDLLVRRKRVDSFGEWEYECVYCDRWLPKNKFRGCIDYIDAYGNCLMCSSCRASKAQITQKENMRTEVDYMLKQLGYDLSGEIPVHIQFLMRHNLPIKEKDL